VRPTWLTGVIYGPHTRLSVEDVRKRVPSSLPLRHYPDMCHQIKAQFPAQNWSHAFAFTEVSRYT
jgi:hypothetical protein